jgi:hypothetical protein
LSFNLNPNSGIPSAEPAALQSNFAGWERYLELESTIEALVSFSGTRYGKVAASNFVPSPSNRSIRINLVCSRPDSWGWNVTVQPHR